jgi:hypothetical protein
MGNRGHHGEKGKNLFDRKLLYVIIKVSFWKKPAAIRGIQERILEDKGKDRYSFCPGYSDDLRFFVSILKEFTNF